MSKTLNEKTKQALCETPIFPQLLQLNHTLNYNYFGMSMIQ